MTFLSFDSYDQELKDTGGMFDWSYYDNSKVIMFDDWNVLFLKKNI